MKLRLKDQVKVTAGKDKGKTGVITHVFISTNRVIVGGVNMITKHRRKTTGQAGERISVERSLPVASVAILNDKGEIDRISYKREKDGSKTRIFAKTKKPLPVASPTPAKKKKDA